MVKQLNLTENLLRHWELARLMFPWDDVFRAASLYPAYAVSPRSRLLRASWFTIVATIHWYQCQVYRRAWDGHELAAICRNVLRDCHLLLAHSADFISVSGVVWWGVSLHAETAGLSL